jgi:hypothetical protein
LTLTTLAAFVLIMTAAASTQATVLRAFVSSTGADANTATNCAQSAPCKTFNAAIAVVTPGGELIALDTSGYGPITNVNKAITIATIPGVTAFVVVATGTAGFTINGGATDLIVLRNISFNGTGAANTTGVQHNSGTLVIDHCKFTQSTIGLNVVSAKVDVTDCDFIGNTTGVKASGPGSDDQNCAPCNGTTQVRFDRGNLQDNGTALQSLDPDFRPASTDNRKQFLFHNVGSWTTNITGNTNFKSASGLGCTLGCSTITIDYSNQANPH